MSQDEEMRCLLLAGMPINEPVGETMNLVLFNFICIYNLVRYVVCSLSCARDWSG
jgi:hypothetical protein